VVVVTFSLLIISVRRIREHEYGEDPQKASESLTGP